MRKRWLVGLLLLAIAVAGVSYIAWRGGSEPADTPGGLRKVDDWPLYVLRYEGDYGFGEYLRTGKYPSFGSVDLQRSAWACTCFAALNSEGDRVFGRNFDWGEKHPALLLFTDPPDGYASVSMVDISYLGFDRAGPLPESADQLERAPYLPFDGMNEQGLAVGMMAVEDTGAGSNPSRRTLDSLEVIRLLLDYASDVDEAVALMGQYNVDWGGGPALHYLLADSSGHSAVVEFVGGEMRVLRNTDDWQVSTNFVISETPAPSCWRYAKASAALNDAGGRMSVDEAMAVLAGVAQGGDYPTIWSTVYNLTSGEVRVVMGRKYGKVHTFRIGE
jgi:hypothetical protein